MSRFNRFARSLASSYVTLGANVAFTLASVPLANSWLSKSEFGLWALTTQINGYIALIDLGMSGSVARILIDYKDDKDGGAYGSVIRTGWLVSFAQALIIFVAGLGLAFALGPALKVPDALQPDFRILIIGQCAILAVNFLCRIFSHLLTAHQRYDLINYPQAAAFAANYALLWVGFSHGGGIFSMLWGQLAGLIIGMLYPALSCWRLRLFPSAGHWGRLSFGKFKELFAFGRDIFLFSLGSQLITASQIIVVTRCLGLEAAATWSVCTRSYLVVTQLVWRILDSSGASLAEMVVRGERDRLLRRFRQVTMLSAALATVAAIIFAVTNQPFVQVWMRGKFGWSPWTDVFLGLWLVLMTIQRCHSGLLGVMKQLRVIKYVYFLEGAVFVTLAVVVSRVGGFPAVAATSVVCTAIFSLAFGVWRTKTQFHLSFKEVAWEWLWPAVRIGLVLGAVALLISMAFEHSNPKPKLALAFAVLGPIGLWLLWRWGVDSPIQQEILQRAPPLIAPMLRLAAKGLSFRV